MIKFLNKFFKLEENKTTVKTELIAGLTTFFAMCYIIVVNPNQMTGFKPLPEIWNACFVGGIIAAVIATLCMAFIANKPFALAAGMGLNSFFYVSFILPCVLNLKSVEKGYGAGLAVILLSGIIFLILSITGLRKIIATSLPKCLKSAIPAGIGLFIAFIGFKNSGIVVGNEFTFVALADFTSWQTAAPAIVALIGFLAIVYFSKSKIAFLRNGAVILGIALSTILFYLFGLKVDVTETSIGETFKDWIQYYEDEYAEEKRQEEEYEAARQNLIAKFDNPVLREVLNKYVSSNEMIEKLLLTV